MSLFAPLLPREVRVAEQWGPLPDRDARFRAGRRLARDLIGAPGATMPRGHRGAPVWPDGVVGSITHTQEYAAVAVASSRAVDSSHAVASSHAVDSIGIDAEPIAALPPETVAVVSNPQEIGSLDPVAAGAGALLSFVAKEAVFKAWWPLHERELDFAEVDLAPVGDGRLVAHHPEGEWPVRWRAAEGMLLAAVVVTSGVRAERAARGSATTRRRVR
ncbi:MAG TPA: 4'-phosphopantetheinyl transferase superfamily protein [Intrasporangiaceae bacterium]|nr:4'-phosphopantetheinyl transferase superfamily protein [Intrasporangiaceae bacterium]